MSEGMDSLVELMRLERLENNLFRGQSRKIVGKRVFGGQVLGQALVAANSTVEGRVAHSLQAYFLWPGDAGAPIVYDVERVRDGGSFSTRRVKAIQHGRTIFDLAASFQIVEPGAEHQDHMPEVPAPEGLPTELELIEQYLQRSPVSEKLQRSLRRPRPIEVRPVDPEDPLNPTPHEPRKHLWFRSRGPLPDGYPLHQALLAFASDHGLLSTALRPHCLSFLQPDLQLASLDHSMWFHRQFRLDDWLLFSMDSPSASGARGFTRGQIFSRDGRLVASVTQEGLMRKQG